MYEFCDPAYMLSTRLSDLTLGDLLPWVGAYLLIQLFISVIDHLADFVVSPFRKPKEVKSCECEKDRNAKGNDELPY